MAYQVFSDSSCNMPGHVIDELGVKVFPLVFTVDGQHYQSYLEGEDVDLKQFYDMMREGKVITTSLPNLADAREMLVDTLERGNDVLYLGFSSGLSGTYEAIDLMMRDLGEQYPDRKLISVDSLAASGGEGLLLWHAMQMVDSGATMEEVAEWLEANKLKCAHWFTVDDLMFLFRGGRVSRSSAWAGTLLKIKPVMHVDNAGHLIPLEKVRGRKKSLDALVDHMEQSASAPVADQKVIITHGDCQEDADYVAAQIRERFGCIDIDIYIVDPVIGAHAGPGTLALFFMASGR